MRPRKSELLSKLVSPSRWRRCVSDDTSSRQRRPSHLLTQHLNVQPKVFERELWNIFDNIEKHPWTTRERLTEIRNDIFKAKAMKKEINPALNKHRELKDKLAELTLKLGEGEGEASADAGSAAAAAAASELERLTTELEEVRCRVAPRAAELDALEDGIYDQVVFYPNCRPSTATGPEDRVIMSVSCHRRVDL